MLLSRGALAAGLWKVGVAGGVVVTGDLRGQVGGKTDGGGGLRDGGGVGTGLGSAVLSGKDGIRQWI